MQGAETDAVVEPVAGDAEVAMVSVSSFAAM